MPGIVGLTQTGDRSGPTRETVGRMQRAITHRDFYELGPTEGDEHVVGAASLHFPVDDPIAANEYHDDRLHVWLHGEVLRGEDVAREVGLEGRPDQAALLAALYRHCADWEFLGRLDGLFSAAIYDADGQSVHLVTDPWGLCFLHWTDIDGELAWATEVKAFLAHRSFAPVVDRGTVEHFVSTGQLYGDETWFRDVRSVPPGSVVSRDVTSGDISTVRYWDWRDIRPTSETVDARTAAHRLGELFGEAIDLRTRESHLYGLGLSGGLDSRALLAELSAQGRAECRTLTFGHPNCRDVHVARRVAERAGVDHTVFPIDETNWFDRRVEGVWLTDGQWSLQHMHSMVCLPDVPGMFDVHLSGALGDAIYAGFYENFDGRRLEDVLETRGRRMINQGRRLYDVFRHNRLPFLDRDLVEFALALPRDLLADGGVYDSMLLDRHPRYFRQIPDANTGRPIGWPAWRRELDRRIREPVDDLRRRIPLVDDPPREMYVSYGDWFGGPSHRDAIETILFGDAVRYPDFLPHLPIRQMWEAQCRGRNTGDWKILSRVMTFEIWLQQVFEQRWRSGLGEAGIDEATGQRGNRHGR